MRICHVITRLIIGGAQENTVLTCRGLKERGHDVTLIAGPETGPEGSLWDDARKTACKIVTLDSLRRAVHPFRDWRATVELRKMFESIQPDVVHTHSSKAGIVARAAAARARVPLVVHTIHGMSFNRTQPAMVRWVYKSLERWAGHRTQAIVTVADAMIEQAVAARLAPRNRFQSIRSGLETDRFRPQRDLRTKYREQWKIAPDEIVVGTVARLFKNKGYEEIIHAMPAAVSREQRLRFVWIGDGAHRGEYERQLVELGLRDRVHLVGLISPDEVASQINGFDVILHASRWEGLPRALVQGLLTEIPAISFDNDGAPEVVETDSTGILVPYGRIDELSDAIVKLAGDPELRRRLGAEGRRRCAEKFDWRKMVDDIDRLYQKLADQRA